MPGVEGLDTRRLVRHLRQRGAMRGALSTEVADPGRLRELALAAPDPNGLAMVDQVTRAAPVELPADGDEHLRVVLYDFGAKANIARRLRRLGARVRVVPAATPAAEALAWRPRRGDAVQRPRRPGHRRPRRPGDPRPARPGAAVRHLPRPPAPRPGRRRPHRPAQVRPPGRQPAGGRAGHRPGRGHQPQPRLRGRRRQPAREACGSPTPTPTTASSRAWSAWTCPPSRSSTTPRPPPAPMTPTPCSSGSPA